MVFMEITSRSIADTAQAAREIYKEIARGRGGHGAAVVSLTGELGAGKTTFVQELARALGVEERVQSPTFVIEKVYKIKKSEHFSHLIHFDAYRIENTEEIKRLGWHELVRDPENLVVVEWGERIRDILPSGTKHIQFETIDEHTRKISWQ